MVLDLIPIPYKKNLVPIPNRLFLGICNKVRKHRVIFGSNFCENCFLVLGGRDNTCLQTPPIEANNEWISSHEKLYIFCLL